MTSDQYDETDEPRLTRPSQPNDGFSLTLFTTPDAARYAIDYKVMSEGWYSLKHVGTHGTLNFLRRASPGYDSATADMSNGIPIGEQTVGLVFYAAPNDRFMVWRESLSDNASLSYWGRKKPDFPQGATVNCGPVGIYLSLNDEEPCPHTASDVQFLEGDGIEIVIGCPTEDGGVGTVEITATGGSPEYLWMELLYDIHADHFSGANGVHVDSYLEDQDQTYYFVLNDHWLTSDLVHHQE